MLLPYATDARSTQPPLATVALILANFTVFGIIAAVTLTRGPELPTQWFAALSLVPASPRIQTVLTYCLLHEDVFHLSANMLFVWVFGGPVEEDVGWQRFLLLYGLAAVGSGLAQAAAARIAGTAAAEMPIIGASGAAAALVGAFAVRYYRASIRFIGLPVRIPAAALLAGAVAAEVVAAGLQMVRPASAAAGSWAAHSGHVAGFILGILWARATGMPSHGQTAYLRADAAKIASDGTPMSALRRWEEVLAKRPSDVQAHAQIALLWAVAGDREQCAEHYRSAVAGWMRNGNRQAAAETFCTIQEQLPGDDLGLTHEEALFVASGLEELGATEQAVALLQRAAKHWNSDAAALRACVLLLRRLHAHHRAADGLREFLEDYPASEWRQYAAQMLREAEESAQSNRSSP
ncbi:MAG: rhomboid family intramembrane serine protease [Chthonomonadales bacterium]